MMNMQLSKYVKIIVVEVNPFDESTIVAEVNCKAEDSDDVLSDLKEDFPSNTYSYLVKKIELIIK